MNLFTLGCLILLFANIVLGKECDCGENCKRFDGYEHEERCYYVAPISSMNGEQYLVSNVQEERMVINGVLRELTSKSMLYIATDNSYKTSIFASDCHPVNCTSTVYVSECHCKLNTAEKVWSVVQEFYKEYNILFWISIVFIVLLIILPVVKCIVCKK